MMLAGLPVPDDAVEELAGLVRAAADELAELRAVLLNDHQWRRGEGLD